MLLDRSDHHSPGSRIDYRGAFTRPPGRPMRPPLEWQPREPGWKQYATAASGGDKRDQRKEPHAPSFPPSEAQSGNTPASTTVEFLAGFPLTRCALAGMTNGNTA